MAAIVLKSLMPIQSGEPMPAISRAALIIRPICNVTQVHNLLCPASVALGQEYSGRDFELTELHPLVTSEDYRDKASFKPPEHLTDCQC